MLAVVRFILTWTRFVERDHLGLLPSFRMPKDSLLVHRELSHCSPYILYKIHRHPQHPSRAMCRGALSILAEHDGVVIARYTPKIRRIAPVPILLEAEHVDIVINARKEVLDILTILLSLLFGFSVAGAVN